MGSPVPLSAESVGIITRLRNMKVYIMFSFAQLPSSPCAQDEDEDWGRWRDVVFRAKGRLAPHGIDLKPPPPQNRRKRGGPAFVKDPWKAEDNRIAGAEASSDPKADSIERPMEQNPGAPEDPAPTQLTTLEALSKLANASEEISSLNSQPTDSNTNSVTASNGMTYCPECYLPLHPDPKPEKLYIFLHALRYTTSLGCFETEMPEWAAEGWEWDRS